MTNYNERLEDLLTELRSGTINFDDKAKQAITSLIKELVAEARPGTWVDPEDTDDLKWQGYVSGVNEFEQNLLKALEEV